MQTELGLISEGVARISGSIRVNLPRDTAWSGNPSFARSSPHRAAIKTDDSGREEAGNVDSSGQLSRGTSTESTGADRIYAADGPSRRLQASQTHYTVLTSPEEATCGSLPRIGGDQQ